MEESRKGEIAILVVKRMIKKHGINFGPCFKQKMAEEAFSTGVTPEELIEFLKPLVLEAVDENFNLQ